MATILGWLLYFRIDFIVETLTLSKKGWLFEYLLISGFGTISQKKVI